MKYQYRIPLVVCIISIVLFLPSNGCSVFGGGGKEEAEAETKEVSQETPAEEEKEPAAEPQIEIEPAVTTQTADKSFFQEGERDVQQVVQIADASGGVVEGKVNWSKGFITAVGKGLSRPEDTTDMQAKISAREAAYTIALANLLETTKGVQVTSETTVEMLMLKSQVVTRKVEGVIKGAMILDEMYEEENGQVIASVMVGLVLGDIPPNVPPPKFEKSTQFEPSKSKSSVSNVALLEHTSQAIDTEGKFVAAVDFSEADSLDEIEIMMKEKAKESGQQDDETFKALLAEMQAIRILLERPPDPSKPYTGIVFNTAKADMRRVLFPKVYVESSDTDDYRLVYGDTTKERPSPIVTSWSGWAQTVDDAKENSKVLDNPIVIDNVQVNDGEAAIIRPEDAEMLNKLEEEHKFLAQGKVVFLL